MPQPFGTYLAVTLKELVPQYWKSYGALKKKLKRDEKRYPDGSAGLHRLQRGGGNHELLIDFESLPKWIQDDIGDPRKTGHLLEDYYTVDAEATRYYNGEGTSGFRYPDGSYLKPETADRYITSASLLKAILHLKEERIAERKKMGGSLRGIAQTLLDDLKSFTPVLEKDYKETHTIPMSLRHFKNTLNNFEKQGYYSLIKDAKGKVKQNARKNDEQTQQLLNNLFAMQPHKPHPTEIARQYEAFLNGYLEIINAETGEMYNPKEFKMLGESSIKKYLTSWDSQMATHIVRNGDRQKLRQQFVPYHSLERPTFAGSVLSIDDRQPPFHYEKSKRMWFYNGIDLASEAFTVFVYGKTKEGIIMDFYRQLVRNYHEWGLHLPAELECESALNASFKNTFLKEGTMFDHVRIEANNARGKKIERYFGKLRYGIEKAREGWLARPFARGEANQISNEKDIIIPYDELAVQCIQDIITWNNMEHSQIKGKTRWEVFLENQNPDLKPTNYRAIMPHLGYTFKDGRSTSCNAGIVKLQNKEWLLGDNGEIYTGEALISLMKQVEGHDLYEVYWLDDNNGSVFKAMVYREGRYICELLPKPRYNRSKSERTQEDEVARDLMTRYVMTVEGYMRRSKNELEKVAIIDNQPKVLNNKFTIKGFENFVPREEPAEVIEDHTEDEYEFNYMPNKSESTALDWRANI